MITKTLPSNVLVFFFNPCLSPICPDTICFQVGDGEDASSMMDEEGDDDSDDLEDEDFDPDSASDFSEEPRPFKRKRVDPQGAGPSTAGNTSLPSG